MSADDLISKGETATLLGGQSEPVSISFVNQLLAKKKLPKVRLSYRVCRIPRAAVEEYIRSHTTAQRGVA
jgi:hypothetical protein